VVSVLSQLDLLVVSDLHYVCRADHVCGIETRKSSLGPVLLRKAVQRMHHMKNKVDLVVLLGDMVDNGLADRAEDDLAEIAHCLRQLDIPFLCLPGNHDGDASRFASTFACDPGLHEICGYGFLVFHDQVGEGDVTTRPAEELALPQKVRALHPDMPLVALQHNPLHPNIESTYPYMPTNTAEILETYATADVTLSLSGHYHPGQAAHRVNKTTCYTVPALCEAPFRFAHVRLDGRQATVVEHALRLDEAGLMDVHCHTQYAHCADDVDARQNVDIAGAMGLETLCLTEHAYHLYLDREAAWNYEWQTDLDLVRRALCQRGRMPQYREYIAELRRNGSVRCGLEVDLCADGRLLLAQEDFEGWDVLLGAVHNIHDFQAGVTTQAEAEQLFLRDTQRLLENPVQVLAHPFRFFRRAGLEIPVHLFPTVAQMLAQAGVAAEVNFHTNDPDLRFVRECLNRNVRIAFGTDSHDLREVGELYPHLDLLKQAGVTTADFAEVLYRLPVRDGGCC
jgi:histidinol phosphatase-like PHP family hydrolase/predicted phosphodiesterase